MCGNLGSEWNNINNQGAATVIIGLHSSRFIDCVFIKHFTFKSYENMFQPNSCSINLGNDIVTNLDNNHVDINSSNDIVTNLGKMHVISSGNDLAVSY